MIEINGKQFRNLEEQVLFNSERIDRILDTNVLLAQFGIKVIDQFATEAELLEYYPPASYVGDYGNAVLIGTEPPYDYYIWTRVFPSETAEAINGTWFNIGEFPLPGPAGKNGEKGVQGERGQRGKSWFSGVGAPGDAITDAIVGDLFFQTSPTFGAVYRYNGAVWQYQGNLRGADGAAGAPGAQGPAGPIVDLLGTLTSIDQLPENIPEFVAEYGRQAAYLVGAEGETKKVYGLVGPDDNLTWDALGLFAAGTQVFVSGQPVESIEMSQYVKFTPSSASTQVVAYDSETQTYQSKTLTTGVVNGSVAMRTTNGTLKAKDPVEDNDLATKKYVNDTIGGVVHDKYFYPMDISHREFVEDPDSEYGGYDETIVSGPYYLDLVPGMDFYIDVDFEMSDIIPLIQLEGSYSQSGNSWSPIWDDWSSEPSTAFTAQHHYHITVSKGADGGYPVVRTETTSIDNNHYYTGPAYRINGYDLRIQATEGYQRFRLKMWYNDQYSWIEYYNMIGYTGNVEPNIYS